MENERRKYKRIKFLVISSEDKSEIPGEISNLSMGGCFIRSEKLLAIGSVIDIIYVIPSTNNRIITKGKVVFHKKRPKGMGIDFIMMDANYRDILNEFLKG